VQDELPLEELLRSHARRYPLMQVCDAVKILYQNEFGSGHLVQDPESSLRYLQQEYASLTKDNGGEAYEDIGNGYVRLNLTALSTTAYSLEDVNRLFVATAKEGKGSLANFLAKLELLRTLTKENAFSFGLAELEQYLVAYREQGCPVVSHSAQYRQAYAPAYRVILQRLLEVRPR